MAMACCRKEYAEDCEILVSADAPAPHNLNLSESLRFGLLSSSWLPIPLGIFLWSALHVMLLIVGGPAVWVVGLLTAFLYWAIIIGLSMILYVVIFVVVGLIVVALDLVCLLVESIRFCRLFLGFLACHEPIVEWRGGARETVKLFTKSWNDIRCARRDMSAVWFSLSMTVPCLSSTDDSFNALMERKLKTWARWWEEMVHMHDTIAL